MATICGVAKVGYVGTIFHNAKSKSVMWNGSYASTKKALNLEVRRKLQATNNIVEHPSREDFEVAT